jgi:hypothetical protein
MTNMVAFFKVEMSINDRGGEKLIMNRLKKILAGTAITVATFGSIAFPAFAVSDNASQNACFGQGRAAYATTSAPGAVGEAASARKGDNAAQNAAYREACQSAT